MVVHFCSLIKIGRCIPVSGDGKLREFLEALWSVGWEEYNYTKIPGRYLAISLLSILGFFLFLLELWW